jgi:hypothetical protein
MDEAGGDREIESYRKQYQIRTRPHCCGHKDIIMSRNRIKIKQVKFQTAVVLATRVVHFRVRKTIHEVKNFYVVVW